MKIFNQLEHTHMPYIIDENTMLFSKAPIKDRCIEIDAMVKEPELVTKTYYQAYDIYSSDLDGSNEIFVSANAGERIIACSPTCFVEDGEIVMNFVMAYIRTGYTKSYHLQRRGATLETLGAPRRVYNKWGIGAYTNCETSRYVFTPHCGVNTRFFFLTDKEYGTESKYTLSRGQIRRMTPIANDEKNVIIMVFDENQPFSCLLNLETRVMKEIHVNGKRIYKCSIFNNTVIHTVRGTGSVYSRQLHTDDYTLVNSTINVSIE